MKAKSLFYSILLPVLLLSCSQSTEVEDLSKVSNPPGTSTKGQTIFIVDQTGKRWDITHAVKRYGMQAYRFQFGSGPNAILPILFPDYFSAGDPGFPAPHRDFLIIGTRLNNDARAYPLFVMKSREIVDEVIGGAAVAVAY